jgi:hypothetical protein
VTDLDPYEPLIALAEGWRVHSDDLIDRAEKLTTRAVGINAKAERALFDPDPEALLVAARHNRAMAIGYSSAAADLDHSITFARRHVLDPS